MKRREFIKRSAAGTAVMSGLVLNGCSTKKEYDLVIVGGVVYDGGQSTAKRVSSC